ncbi:MAG: hypothetical protein ACLRP3_19795 [Escherichia sp.]
MTKLPESRFMGKRTRATTEEICRLTSPETCGIGQAGKTLFLSGMLNSRNHSGGAELAQ